MRRNKSQQKAQAALNYDLFQVESLTLPAPATLYTRIREEAVAERMVDLPTTEVAGDLPTLEELYRMFDRFNWIYFEGRLPKVQIEYSTRMSSAGSYTPGRRLIRIGRKYHQLFPDEIADTLKHEMIHIRHFRHDAEFKREAKRIGASVRAKSHPSLRKPPRYLYVCPHCSREYPRQKRLRMASCGVCSKGRRFDKRYKLKLKKPQA
ncbi:MAG: SprT-like domain-containing protein [candidate division Zixibacteria bacterium]|nr:SprT-like domain-containing protein [candidate division Zixibacteria bacterium]MDH3936332.1 SprT-like domain-containing protein [candidate division Zixibacteria bacterium]MDH4035308.1 SprT-like domain-containing protein [candidate division Zixibacteria bacterium]